MTTMNINNMTRTWNSGGTTYEAIKMNVTDAASAAGSLLLSLQVGGASKFMIGKAGTATITSSDAGAGAGPTLTLHRDSASPADDDVLGEVVFAGEDDGGAQTNYARIYAQAKDVTNSTEDGALFLQAMIAGSLTTVASFTDTLASFGTPVTDETTFADPADPTKRVRWDAVGVTAGNTRVVTAPDVDISLVPATEAQMESASVTNQFVAPANVKHHPGVAKAYAQISSGHALVGGYNVGSISSAGTGINTVNFSVNFANTTSMVPVTAIANIGSGNATPHALAVGSVRCDTYNSTPTLADIACFIAVFGTQ